MKTNKVILFLTVVCLFVAGCKKDTNTVPSILPEQPLLPENGPAVSAAIEVLNSLRVNSGIPSSALGGGMTITYYSAIDHEHNIPGGYNHVISGGYATAVGYYVQVEGATNQHFKVEVPAANQGRSMVITIKLPPQLQPGVLCFDISAYDNTGKIFNIDKHCVTIVKPGSSTVTNFIGSWKLTGTKRYGVWDYDVYSPKNYQMWSYNCFNNRLSGTWSNGSGNPSVTLAITQTQLEKYNLYIQTDNKLKTETKDYSLIIDEINSFCNKPVYTRDAGSDYTQEGKWAYKDSENTLVAIYYSDPLISGDLSTTYAVIYKIISNDGTKMIVQLSNGNQQEYTRF
jgi:hypothetical protein